jgi:hypothetical protein
MAQAHNADSSTHRPVHVIDHFPVQAAIWINTAENGGVWHSVTVTKRYKLAESAASVQSEYGTTHSLSADDLLPAAQALEAAYAWIQKRRHDDHVAAGSVSSGH